MHVKRNGKWFSCGKRERNSPDLTKYWNSVKLNYGILNIGGNMRQNLLVSSRGQITLPSSVRKRLGIQTGGIVTLEQRDNVVVLRPAAVVEIETFSDEDIARWDKEDRLEPGERNALLKRLRKRS
jgi:AbrB family looped-hinge helix DNA binding protein